MPTKAAIYVRLSKASAGDREPSLKAQENEARKLCAARGWAVAEVFEDRGVSGWSDRARPAFTAARELIADGGADVFVAHRLDRVARTMVGLIELDRFLGEHGAAVALVTEDFDTTTAAGRLARDVIARFGEHYSDQLSEKIQNALNLKAAAGDPQNGGVRLYGYDAQRTTVNEREAKLVREMAARALKGEALGAIAKDFERRGVKTASGTEWTTKTVRRILANPAYAGLRVHTKRANQRNTKRNAKRTVAGTYAGSWPAILTPAQHKRLAALLNDPSRNTSPGTAVRHLLAGFLACGVCGAKMYSKKIRGGQPGYACLGGHVAVMAHYVEPEVSTSILEALDNMPTTAPATGARTLRAELDRIEAKQAQLAEMFAADELSASEWKTAREGLAQRHEAASTALRNITSTSAAPKLPAGTAARVAWWKSADLASRRALLDATVSVITIERATPAGGVFDPERVRIQWRG
jgi:DNA invertase Pin-like site-specific DNA recombinase